MTHQLPPLGLVHVPKTAGISLHDALTAHYGQRKTYRAGGPEAVQLIRERGAAFADQFDLITGHLPIYQFMAVCERPRMFVSVVREPLERLVSLHNYVSTTPSHPYFKLWGQLSFEAFAEHTLDEPTLRGGQCRFFAKGRTFADAKHSIESNLTMVGTTGALSAFLAALSALLGAPLELPRRNVSLGAAKVSDIPPALAAKLSDYLAEDVMLYNWITTQPGSLWKSDQA